MKRRCIWVLLLAAYLLAGCNILTPKAEREALAANVEAQRIRSEAYEQIQENPAQYVEYEGLRASSFDFSVHLEHTTYAYTDLIYVTATFINRSDEPMTLWTPSESRFFHQELPTVITNGSDRLMDVDIPVYERFDMGPSAEPGTLVLAPEERYVQIMRFSPNVFSNFDGKKVQVDSGEAASGDYHGTVTAYVMENGEPVPYTVEFDITIGPDLGLYYPHW